MKLEHSVSKKIKDTKRTVQVEQFRLGVLSRGNHVGHKGETDWEKVYDDFVASVDRMRANIRE
jgi:hypothetical protein